MNSLHIRHCERSEAISGLQNDKDCHDLLRKSRKDGFTLIELSVVLVIIALITSMAVKSGIAVLDTARQTATIKKMAAIDKALLAFRAKNDRLPCPAGLTLTQAANSTTYGVESSGSCTGSVTSNTSVAEGALPTITLGLPNDFMYDAWGNRIRYAVDINSTAKNAFTNTQMDAKFGSITVQYDNTTSHNRTTTAIYALISHGKNSYGGYSVNGVINPTASLNSAEQKNYGQTGVYVQEDLTGTVGASTYFDDIVTYKERTALRIDSDKGGNTIPYIYAGDASRFQKFGIQGNFVSTTSGVGSVYQVTADNNGNLFFLDANSIKRIDSITAAVTTLTGTGYTLNNPSGIAIDKNQYIWIANKSANNLIKLDLSGNLVNIFTAVVNKYGAAANLSAPFSIAIDSKNNVFVFDSSKNIYELDTNGVGITAFYGTSGGGSAFSSATSYIAIDSADNIWVSDSTAANKIQEFTNAGVFIKSLANGSITCTGSTNNNTSYFIPYGIAISPAGDVWVEDGRGSGLLKFNLSATNVGTCVSYGTSTDGLGKLGTPQGLFITSR